MAEQENLRLVRDAYSAFLRGDIQAVLEALADDVVFDTQGPAQIPYAGLFEGKDGASEYFRILAETDDVEVFEPKRFFAEGDMVVVLGRYAARVKATGNRTEIDWVHAFTFRNGKVAHYTDYFDSAKVAQAYERAGTLT